MSSYRLQDSLGYRLSLAARLQERRLEEGLRTLGLTRTTWCVLLAVGVEGLCQPSQIARFVGIDRTATSRALRNLEADGLISRDAGDGDRRTTVVELTARGRSRLAAGVPFAEANATALAAKLRPGEREVLMDMLGRLAEGEEALARF